MMLEKRELAIPEKYGPGRLLEKELLEMGTRVNGRGRESFGA